MGQRSVRDAGGLPPAYGLAANRFNDALYCTYTRNLLNSNVRRTANFFNSSNITLSVRP